MGMRYLSMSMMEDAYNNPPTIFFLEINRATLPSGFYFFNLIKTPET